MRRPITSLLALLCAIPAIAQERLPVSTAPGKPHAALARMTGDWQAHATFWAWENQSAPPRQKRHAIFATPLI